jgi:energy-coupling factor transporter ATP-binding protein EcfA2
LDISKADARRRAVKLLDEVGIPAAASRVDSYPHQLSGGMRQRVVLALVLCTAPELIIADEPTTALDVSVQAQIIALIKALAKNYGTSVMLITHDLGVVAEIADRVAVMYAGRMVEIGSVARCAEGRQASLQPGIGERNSEPCVRAPALCVKSRVRCRDCTPCRMDALSTRAASSCSNAAAWNAPCRFVPAISKWRAGCMAKLSGQVHERRCNGGSRRALVPIRRVAALAQPHLQSGGAGDAHSRR